MLLSGQVKSPAKASVTFTLKQQSGRSRRAGLHRAPHHDAVLGGQAQRHHALQLPAAGLKQGAPLAGAALLAAAHDQHLEGGAQEGGQKW